MNAILTGKTKQHTSPTALVLGLLLLLLAPAVLAGQTTLENKTSGNADPVWDFFESEALWAALRDESQPLKKTLNEVHRKSYFVPFAPGKKLFVTEYFTVQSLLREPARAVIFLTAAEYRGSFWDIPGEGRSGPAMAAERGFFAYTIDSLGMGKSHRPEDGSKVAGLDNAKAVSELIDRIRRSRQVDRVNLVGEGFGGEVAAALADDPERVGSMVLSSLWYKEFSPSFAAFALSPGFEAFLRSHPDGYWVPNFVETTLLATPDQDIRDYVFATQQDLEVATGPYLQYIDPGLPVINATAAKVPALIITAEFNPFPAPGDMDELTADWGGGASLVVLEGSFHVSRIETPEIAERYFQEMFDFLDP